MILKKCCAIGIIAAIAVTVLPAKNASAASVAGVFMKFKNTSMDFKNTKAVTYPLGGLSFSLQHELIPHFGIYGVLNTGFGRSYSTSVTERSRSHYKHERNRYSHDFTYAVDTQFGFYYLFRLSQVLNIFLGGGFGIGGNGWISKNAAGVSTELNVLNIGGGLTLDITYMFSKTIGVFGGISETLYAPVAVFEKVKSSSGSISSTTYTGLDIENKASIRKLSIASSIRLGFRFLF